MIMASRLRYRRADHPEVLSSARVVGKASRSARQAAHMTQQQVGDRSRSG